MAPMIIRTNKKNIVLIGFMGVGKGLIGRALAQDLGMFLIDSDDLIQTQENKKVRQIFEKKGEKYFREQEQRLAAWFGANVKNTILATGGGFCVYVKDIQKLGTVIWLNTPFDAIFKRITTSANAKKKLQKRPLFKSYDEAKKLYEVREIIYKNSAHIQIQTQDKSPEQIVSEIKSRL